MTLAEHLSTRENGLTSLRLFLAALVVFGHAYELGGFGPDPLFRLIGITCGELAVNSFFAISGYLVAGSWFRSASTFDYLRKRCLRIFPGFWACLLLLGFIFIPCLAFFLHDLSWSSTLSESSGYVWKNALLKINQAQVAPLFLTQPAAGVINGSLWTLFPEFLCYLGIAVIGPLGLLTLPLRRYLPGLVCLLYFAQAFAPVVWPGLRTGEDGHAWWLWRLGTQAIYFAGGVLLQLWAARVPVRGGIMLLLGLLLAVASWSRLYPWFAPLFLPTLVLMLPAFFPSILRRDSADYSYGIYIYHYPLAQALVACKFTPTQPGFFFLLTLLVTLPLAVLSWHLIERPALRHKPRALSLT